MAKYIDPTYDVGFKLTFGRENQSEELLMSAEERRSYEADVKNARDTLNQIRYAEQQVEARGEARGIKIGEAKGIRKNHLHTARVMLEAGLPAEDVSRYTGLSITEINQL